MEVSSVSEYVIIWENGNVLIKFELDPLIIL